MRPLTSHPNLAEQVHHEILAEIISGRLGEHARLIQDELARQLGVSRQPVQQALLLLRSQGFVREAHGRGLEVAPIDIGFVRDLYEFRAVTEGLAARLSALRNSEKAAKLGPKLIEEGHKAESEGSVPKLIAADVKFHELLYELSGNRLIGETAQPHWMHLRRVMGEVLLRDGKPRRIWDQHQEILDAIIRKDASEAEQLAKVHITNAAGVFIARLEKLRAEAMAAADAAALPRV